MVGIIYFVDNKNLMIGKFIFQKLIFQKTPTRQIRQCMFMDKRNTINIVIMEWMIFYNNIPDGQFYDII